MQVSGLHDRPSKQILHTYKFRHLRTAVKGANEGMAVGPGRTHITNEHNRPPFASFQTSGFVHNVKETGAATAMTDVKTVPYPFK